MRFISCHDGRLQLLGELEARAVRHRVFKTGLKASILLLRRAVWRAGPCMNCFTRLGMGSRGFLLGCWHWRRVKLRRRA